MTTAQQLSIATNNAIQLDGEWTEFHIRQTKDVTEVYHHDTDEILQLPAAQYSTTAERPACGNGRTKFYTDFKAAYQAWRTAR